MRKLNQDLLRQLALMQYNGEDFFILNDQAFEGTESEAIAAYDEDKQTHAEPITFEEWVIGNCVEIADYNTEDYNNDYLVLTDSEADDKWEESLDNYIDECIIPELPEFAKNYFDTEGWKKDARYDGRGHSLASYDGNENEETVEGETFYIYRIN